MSKPIFSHEDLMREIAARHELRLATHEEGRTPNTPAEIIPFKASARAKPPRYRIH